MSRFVCLAIAVALLVPVTARPEEGRATTKEAEMLVHNAVAFLKKEGRDKAFASFNDPKGAFTYRDLYIFVYDTQGFTFANGGKKEVVGKNMFNLKDADGKLFIQDGINIAKTQGRGWSEYRWPNPATGRIEPKVSYVEFVDGLVVGCGAYRK